VIGKGVHLNSRRGLSIKAILLLRADLLEWQVRGRRKGEWRGRLERRREGERVEKEKRDSTLKEDEREGRGGRGFPHFSLECPMTCLWVRGSLWVDCC
jgi:hypothetical protein